MRHAITTAQVIAALICIAWTTSNAAAIPESDALNISIAAGLGIAAALIPIAILHGVRMLCDIRDSVADAASHLQQLRLQAGRSQSREPWQAP